MRHSRGLSVETDSGPSIFGDVPGVKISVTDDFDTSNTSDDMIGYISDVSTNNDGTFKVHVQVTGVVKIDTDVTITVGDAMKDSTEKMLDGSRESEYENGIRVH